MIGSLKRWRRTWAVDFPVLIAVTLAALLYCYEFKVFPPDHEPYAIELDELLLVLIICCCGLVVCSFRALTAQRRRWRGRQKARACGLDKSEVARIVVTSVLISLATVGAVIGLSWLLFH